MEEWKTIEDYPNYQVSNMGRVKSLGNNKTRKEKILKLQSDKDGYFYVILYKDGKAKIFKVHRLVATAFLPNPDNLPQVNHKDENPQNNRVENLEWCDCNYNINYGTRTEKTQKPILQFTLDGELVRKWDSATQVERELGFNQGNISMCCKGKRYKSVSGYRWRYYYKGIWKKKHIPLIKQKRVA